MCCCAGLLKWVRDAIGDLAQFHSRHTVEFFFDQAARDAGALAAGSSRTPWTWTRYSHGSASRETRAGMKLSSARAEARRLHAVRPCSTICTASGRSMNLSPTPSSG